MENTSVAAPEAIATDVAPISPTAPEGVSGVDNTADGSDDLVDLNEASDDDLAAFLEAAKLEEGGKLPDTEEDYTEQDPVQNKTSTTEPPPESAPEKKATDTDPEQISREEYNKLLRRIDSFEEFNRRRSTELGQIRSQLLQVNQRLQEGLEEQFVTSPKQAIDASLAIKENERKIEQIDNENASNQVRLESQKLYAQHVGTAVGVPEMVQSLREDNLPEDFVQRFQQDPWTTADPATIIQLGKRARAEQIVRRLAVAYKEVVAENQRLKTKPQEVVRKIEGALSKTPDISSRAGSGQVDSLLNADPTQMTDEQINIFLSKSGGKRRS